MRYLPLLLFCLIIPILVIGIFLMPKKTIQQPTPVAPMQTETINKLSTETIASNQWYSSIYQSFPSQMMFAFPLAYQLSEKGIGVSLPKVTKTPETIYGSFVEDFTIGLTKKLTKPTIEKIGNWSIGLNMVDMDKHTMSFTLAQGVPFTTIKTNDQQIVLRFKDTYTIADETAEAFRLSIHGNNYLVVTQGNTDIEKQSKEIIIKSQKVFVGILDKPENASLFKKQASDISDTIMTWEIKDNQLQTTYTFVSQDTPLITLLPHQYESLTDKPAILGKYESLRGTLYLIKAKTFTTSMPVITPDITFKPLSQNHPDFMKALRDDYKKILEDKQPENGDYFLGAWYGKAANILLLLDAAGMEEEKQTLLKLLEPKLLRSLNYFRYDKEKQSMIADKPEFGNENLNDHHFHYGYFIRTAAILSIMDPAYNDSVLPYVKKLVADIASTDRTAKQFPFLRNFDTYEGHSWADGFSNFADGNNQESSSESIGAWYSLYLWSQATKDKDLEATALYLYNTEIQSTLYYWFGKNGLYTAPYNHAIGSIVWGGKIDFATWFSAETNMKYGIQILPITPGSFGYLGKLEDITPYETDFYHSGGDVSKPWGDLFVMLTSFYNPEKALSLKNKVTKFEDNNPQSLFLYTLYRNRKN